MSHRETPPAPRAGDPATQMRGPEWGVLELTKENACLRYEVAACRDSLRAAIHIVTFGAEGALTAEVFDWYRNAKRLLNDRT